uniref:Uncharacterized protein n=1 Tax=Globodera rostochiensis TaxID=31243 RepID=A0A914HZW5_GLORO
MALFATSEIFPSENSQLQQQQQQHNNLLGPIMPPRDMRVDTTDSGLLEIRQKRRGYDTMKRAYVRAPPL